MKRKPRQLLWTLASVASLTAGLLASTGAHAALILQWNLTGLPGDQVSTAASTVAPGVTGGVLSRGAGLTTSAAGSSFSAAGWNGQATDYMSLTLTVNSGSVLDLQTLFVGTRSSNTGPGSIGVFYSGDAFLNPIVTLSQSPGSNFVNSAIDLSALPDLTGAVEFRFFQIGAAAANGAATSATGTFRLTDYFNGGVDENLSLTGTLSTPAPVPLPAAGWLLVAGLGALGGAVRRRRPGGGAATN